MVNGSDKAGVVNDSSVADNQSIRSPIDFFRARQQIEQLCEFPGATRARALATYVGLFDLADAHGHVAVPADDVALYFDITRVSWMQCRKVLEAAGLLAVDGDRWRFRSQSVPPQQPNPISRSCCRA